MTVTLPPDAEGIAEAARLLAAGELRAPLLDRAAVEADTVERVMVRRSTTAGF
jgi:hypothetical protein